MTPQFSGCTRGLLKSTGLQIVAAISGTDYAPGTAALATGILKNTTSTGALTIAQASDFPPLNQNTTGTAANVTGTVAVANGGTGLTTLPALSIPVVNALNTLTTLVPAGGQSVRLNANGNAWEAFTPGSGSGTVTSASVVSANGFAGSVANASTSPAITLTTSITGVVKGNGTALSAASSGTDYAPGTASLATGLLKSTTSTGALTIAVAGDFPTLNQNTTGTAANVTGTVAVANGGTGATTSTGTGSNVLNTSPTLVTPALGTPASGNLANCTFPTLNQNTTGTAANVTGTVAVANGGTGVTSASTALTALGAASLAANTFTGDQTIGGHQVINAVLNRYSEVLQSPAISSGALTLDLSTGNVFEVWMSASITAITISNPPSTGYCKFRLTLSYATSGLTAAWPSSVRWPSATAPTLTSISGELDCFEFTSKNGGFSWHGSVVWRNTGTPITTDANTMLLLHMDGDDSNFFDSGLYQNLITNTGSPTQSTAQSVFGGKSGSFNSSSGYLTCADGGGHCNFGTGDLTVDCWAYVANSSGTPAIWSGPEAATGTAGFAVVTYNTATSLFAFLIGGMSAVPASSTSTANAWHHVALVRSSNTVTLYIDGVSLASQAVSTHTVNLAGAIIGYRIPSYGTGLIGYIDEFRISNNARWATGFTPPGTPYS